MRAEIRTESTIDDDYVVKSMDLKGNGESLFQAVVFKVDAWLGRMAACFWESRASEGADLLLLVEFELGAECGFQR
ncbi:MAG TPA: hypothetical protein H9889_01550 [Candidatus Ignatzschineria merdigallinarum]|uniref:Uncharacterized protein n=1 Tax=Candidatus Ignatzschineria merdigallinarum TaxID=2838621 RepID=A0A9D1TTA8_9GAMM|nr:hypothetical protein [Candidatus Ignatzschineria merdigallinarum]